MIWIAACHCYLPPSQWFKLQQRYQVEEGCAVCSCTACMYTSQSVYLLSCTIVKLNPNHRHMPKRILAACARYTWLCTQQSCLGPWAPSGPGHRQDQPGTAHNSYRQQTEYRLPCGSILVGSGSIQRYSPCALPLLPMNKLHTTAESSRHAAFRIQNWSRPDNYGALRHQQKVRHHAWLFQSQLRVCCLFEGHG